MKRNKLSAAAVLSVTALFLFTSSNAVAGRQASTKPGTVDTVLCTIPSVTLKGSTFQMAKKTGCKVNGHALKYSTKITKKFGDLLGPVGPTGVPPIATCSAGPTSVTVAAGKTATTTLPNTTARFHGSLLPGYTKVTFVISAKWQGRTGKATKTWIKADNQVTHAFCGPPAKFNVLQSSTATAPDCEWATTPAMNGLIAIDSPLNCTVPTGGGCKWSIGISLATGNYLAPHDMLTCSGNGVSYNYELNFKVKYTSANGGTSCDPSLLFGYWTASFNASPTWGPGSAEISFGIDNLTLHSYGDSIVYVSAVSLNGTVNPCGGDLSST